MTYAERLNKIREFYTVKGVVDFQAKGVAHGGNGRHDEGEEIAANNFAGELRKALGELKGRSTQIEQVDITVKGAYEFLKDDIYEITLPVRVTFIVKNDSNDEKAAIQKAEAEITSLLKGVKLPKYKADSFKFQPNAYQTIKKEALEYNEKLDKLIQPTYMEKLGLMEKDKKIIDFSDMASNWFEEQNINSTVEAFARGEIAVKIKGHTFLAKGRVAGKSIKKEKYYLAYYNRLDKYAEIFRCTGFSDAEVKYGEGGPKFNNLAGIMERAGVKGLKELEEKENSKAHGFETYMGGEFFNFDNSVDSGCHYYLYNGRWSRGSMAERLSFIEVRKI